MTDKQAADAERIYGVEEGMPRGRLTEEEQARLDALRERIRSGAVKTGAE